MSAESFTPEPLARFGGLITLMEPSQVPNGLSPACRNVEFHPKGVRSRPGLGAPLFQVPASVAVAWNGIKSFITVAQIQRVLAFTSDGRLYRLDPVGGILTNSLLIASNLASAAYMKSTSIFGREYLGFSDGNTNAVDIPRQYDDTNFERCSQGGPGAGPTAGDDASAGNVSAGAHNVVCFFQTRSNGWTKCSPPVQWNAAGAHKALITNIPIGPANVVWRLLAFTLSGGQRYYHLSDRMILKDNVTTTLLVDFTDSTLGSGLSVDFLFNLETIPVAAGVIDYSNRLFWWGETPAMQNWQNSGFDGGFGGNVPLGWTAGANQAGGAPDPVNAQFGSAYRITGNGATAIRGQITQPALIDPWAQQPRINPNQAYTIRARVMRSAGLVQGTLKINIVGTVGTAINTAGLQVTAAQADIKFADFTAELTPAQVALSTDLVIQIQALGTPTNAEYFVIDEIRIYPSSGVGSTYRGSLLRGSMNGQPEQYNGTNGVMSCAESNGQIIRTCFKMREFLYIVKDRSLHVTANDGVTEPGFWEIDEVSPAVGTSSINGVALGEGFAIIANENGAYIYRGGSITDQNKLTTEIQPTWAAFDWANNGGKIWVTIEPKRKRVIFGLADPGSTGPTTGLMLDYTEGWSNPLENDGVGRKWAPWDLVANSAGLIESSSGKRLIVGVGNGNNSALATTGKLYELGYDTSLAATPHSDDGVAIQDSYRTAFLGEELGDQQPSDLACKTLFGWLTYYGHGSGTLVSGAFLPGDVSTVAMAQVPLSAAAASTTQTPLNITAEFVSLQFGTGLNAGDWFDVSKLALFGKPNPWGAP